MKPLPIQSVKITGGFWQPIRDRNRLETLPIQYAQCRDTGRLGVWKLQWKPGDAHPPHIFWDSDTGKWIEAASYALMEVRDEALEALIDEVVEQIARAQQPDGYLNTYFTLVEPENRWTNLRDQHELYCAGHLLEGAIAYFEATGKRRFLDVLCRYIDYIADVFGPGPRQKPGYPGHEEIELALVKLYRITGKQRYLDLAAFFIHQRGREPHYFDIEALARGEQPEKFHFKTYHYCQAHLPVSEQTEAVGHAVRAVYLYCGMADIARETGDEKLLATCRQLWSNLTRCRMHVTGGIGPSHFNEGFTANFDLPQEGAYLETCAAIGLVFWAWRMLQIELRGDYGDVLERALYNGTISGVSSDGKQFFYGNPLAVTPGFDGDGHYRGENYHYRRADWFGTACCPPNLARMIGQMPQFVASQEGGILALHLFAHGTIHAQLADSDLQLTVHTEYPWDDAVRIRIDVTPTAAWTLALRLPGWCRDPHWQVNGREIDAPVQNGYLHLCRQWKPGDELLLSLPMPVECIEAHPAARQNCGRVAVQRGPVVYALEEADNGKNLHDLQLLPDPEFQLTAIQDPLLNGIPLIETIAGFRDLQQWENELYRPAQKRYAQRRIRFIPYFLWANRQPGEMITWIRQS